MLRKFIRVTASSLTLTCLLGVSSLKATLIEENDTKPKTVGIILGCKKDRTFTELEKWVEGAHIIDVRQGMDDVPSTYDSKEFIQTLAKVLSTHKTCTHLSFTLIPMEYAGMICQAIENHPTLTKFSWKNSQCVDKTEVEGLSALTKLFEGNKTEITSLNFTNTNLGGGFGTSEQAKLLARIVRTNKLKELDLKRTGIGDAAPQLVQAIEQNTSLEKLSLNSAFLNSRNFGTKEDRDLALKAKAEQEEKGFIKDYLEVINIELEEELFYRTRPSSNLGVFTRYSILNLLEKKTSLTSLSLSDWYSDTISVKEVIKIAKALEENKNLTQVKLVRFDAFNNDAIFALADMLKKNDTLLSLDLQPKDGQRVYTPIIKDGMRKQQETQVVPNAWSIDALAALEEAVNLNTTLTTLKIGLEPVDNEKAKELFKKIAEKIGNNKVLREEKLLKFQKKRDKSLKTEYSLSN